MTMAKGKYRDWICEEGLAKIKEWAESGLTDKQIAKNIGIREGTLNEWKNRFPALSESLKRGKAVADQEVESALYKSALGYYVEEETYGRIWNANKSDIDLTVVKKVKKWIKPDVTAQIFWLKNRQPERWRDKVIREIETEDGTIGICFLPSRLPAPPPPDMTDREEIIRYYENAIQPEGTPLDLNED